MRLQLQEDRMNNEYIPFPSEILDVIKHTAKEYTFRMEFHGECSPGQFFEVSMPKFGEAPISISGIEPGYVDLTIRKLSGKSVSSQMRSLNIIKVRPCC